MASGYNNRGRQENTRPASSLSHPTARPQPPKPWHKRIRWKKLALSVFALYIVFNLIGGIFSIVDLKKQQSAVGAQLQQAYLEQEQLQKQIDYMNSETAIERAAREKLGLIKPGEILIVRVEGQSEQ